ncbi:uncharacterized protein RSE6_12321 [Rhynchosporium secalis]|uniref:Uncharacterized protein n=1 Tax=Rhynchosporium secalis TaxID=38038 RepID=A0A1E1MQ28_RHYSE|nr:uncharacterized protein RSE6_12321 [Rhynchosporium secalis]
MPRNDWYQVNQLYEDLETSLPFEVEITGGYAGLLLRALVVKEGHDRSRGQLNEHIAATAFYYHDNKNIMPSDPRSKSIWIQMRQLRCHPGHNSRLFLHIPFTPHRIVLPSGSSRMVNREHTVATYEAAVQDVGSVQKAWWSEEVDKQAADSGKPWVENEHQDEGQNISGGRRFSHEYRNSEGAEIEADGGTEVECGETDQSVLAEPILPCASIDEVNI